MQDFVSDLQGIGRPFAWVGGRLSGLVSSSNAGSQSIDAVRQPSELPDGTPMDLDVEVDQTGAAIGKASEAGQQAIEAAAEALDPQSKQRKEESSSAEPVEKEV